MHGVKLLSSATTKKAAEAGISRILYVNVRCPPCRWLGAVMSHLPNSNLGFGGPRPKGPGHTRRPGRRALLWSATSSRKLLRKFHSA